MWVAWGNDESMEIFSRNNESVEFFLSNNDIRIIEHNEEKGIYIIEIINNEKLNRVISKIKSEPRFLFPRLIFHIDDKVIVAGGHSIFFSAPSYVVGTEYYYTPEALTGELRALMQRSRIGNNFDVNINENVVHIFNVERQWRR